MQVCALLLGHDMQNRFFGSFVIAIQIQILAACTSEHSAPPVAIDSTDSTDEPQSVGPSVVEEKPNVESPAPASTTADSKPAVAAPSIPIASTPDELQVCLARQMRLPAGAITYADAALALVDVRDVLVNEMSNTWNDGSISYALTLTFKFRPIRDGKDEKWIYRTIEMTRDSATAIDTPFAVGRYDALPYMSITTGGGCGQSGDGEACGAFSYDGDLPKLNLVVSNRNDREIDGDLEIPDPETGTMLRAGFKALLHAPVEPGNGQAICCVSDF